MRKEQRRGKAEVGNQKQGKKGRKGKIKKGLMQTQ